MDIDPIEDLEELHFMIAIGKIVDSQIKKVHEDRIFCIFDTADNANLKSRMYNNLPGQPGRAPGRVPGSRGDLASYFEMEVKVQ
jgi:hypothetical protein